MVWWAQNLTSGLGYGLLLFLMASGLTLTFGMLGVLNFAHASVYMLGAYLGYSATAQLGFTTSLVLVPLALGVAAVACELMMLRPLRQRRPREGDNSAHINEMLVTFGMAYVILELVQAIWGRGPLPAAAAPAWEGVWHVYGLRLPKLRVLGMGLAIAVALLLWWAVARTRLGILLAAAQFDSATLQALGHNAPRLFTSIFGAGAALAALAGVLGGVIFTTEPGMAAAVSSVLFVVVVVGGAGSLGGAFAASLILGVLQTLCAASSWQVGGVTLSQLSPLMPYALLVLGLAAHPRGFARLGRS